MEPYKVAVSFKGQNDRYGDSTDKGMNYFIQAEGDLAALDIVIREIKDNGPDLVVKGMAVVKLDDTKIIY